MERSYTILLNRGGRYRFPSSPTAQHFEHAARLPVDPPRPIIHRERLTAQELQELATEPDFVAAAEIMRTRLLAPVAGRTSYDSTRYRATPSQLRQSWGLSAVGADRSKFTGAGVSVALLDTGIERDHPAFRGVDLEEKDFTGSGNGDRNGHGTHCAGILFGRNVGGVRIGVAPGVRKALIGKILEGEHGNTDMLARGIVWAHERGAQIVSMSVGLDFAATIRDRIEQGWSGELATSVALEAYRANLELLDCLLQMFRMQEPMTGGSILIGAAGNDSSRGARGEYIMSACPPSGLESVLSVGSLDPSDDTRGHRVSTFSNAGVDIVAPGRDVPSAALGGGLATLSGTSVAAPHVAGVAALWWQAIRQSGLPANATLVRSRLLSGAESSGLSRSSYPSERGVGIVTAPPDGLAARHASGWRNAASEGPVLQQEQIGNDFRNPAESLGFEPISVDLERVHAIPAASRRNLC